MIDLLLTELVETGMTFATARRPLWGMSRRGLDREVLLRGLVDYDDAAQFDEDEDADVAAPGPAMLGWSCAPVYLD
jgi:hypothetical protein